MKRSSRTSPASRLPERSRRYLRRRREWFERVYVALWWVPAGHMPTIGEAVERLDYLETHGPTPAAFGFAQPFEPDGRPLPRGTVAGDACPAG